MAFLTGPRARAAGLAAALAIAAAPASAANPLEDAVKATYLYKFAPFVTWPAAAPAGAFNLCVDGSDSVTALLPQAVAGQQIDGHPIALRPLGGGDVPSDCRILYIAASAGADSVLDTARGKPILTVTAGNGGIIRLIVMDHHVRFDVDTALAADAGLSISSKLLSLAHAVTPAPKGTN